MTLCDDLFNYLIFFLIANVQPNLTILCMVHATQLQNVHQRVGQQTETVQQDLELAVLLRKFSQRCYLLIVWGPMGIVVGTLGNSGGDLGE